jgi:hypothetical protein
MTESGQLQPDETLDDRGVADVLDEGFSPPERLRGSTAKGVMAYEALVGETLQERIRQEDPDPDPLVVPNRPVRDADRTEPAFAEADGELPMYGDDELDDPADQFAGDQRSGRLVAPDQGMGPDDEAEMIGTDVGIDGAAASAEEAAMHEISDAELPATDTDDDRH